MHTAFRMRQIYAIFGQKRQNTGNSGQYYAFMDTNCGCLSFQVGVCFEDAACQFRINAHVDAGFAQHPAPWQRTKQAGS